MDINAKISPELAKALQRLGQEKTDDYYLSMKNILFIHDLAIQAYGGSYGVRDENLLDAVVSAPYQNVFGQELYPEIFDKAAKYIFDFANYQIFIDGNKRTGLLAGNKLLECNGYKLDMSGEKQYLLVMDIANHRIAGYEDVAKILKEHVKFKEPDELIEDMDMDADMEKD